MEILSKDFWDYPPYPYLEQVLQHCPTAGFTYLTLWRDRNKNDHYKIEKKDVHALTMCHPSSFKHQLMLLSREGVASVNETPFDYDIELLRWDDEL